MTILKSISEIRIYETIHDEILVYVMNNKKSGDYQMDSDVAARWLRWINILEHAKINSSLDSSVEQIETMYRLMDVSKI